MSTETILRCYRKLRYVRYKYYRKYRKFRDEKIDPFIEEFWYLRTPAFTALLSLVFFALPDQTLEVYRVFALNPSPNKWQIIISFVFIFLLSFTIWKTAEKLAEKRLEDNKPLKDVYKILQNNSVQEDKQKISEKDKAVISNAKLVDTLKAKALLRLPVIFALSPLVALGWGLFLTIWGSGFGINESTTFFGTFTVLIICTGIILQLSTKEKFLSTLIIMGFIIYLILGVISLVKLPTETGNQFIFAILNPKPHIVPILWLLFGVFITILSSIIYYISVSSFSVQYKKLTEEENPDKPKAPHYHLIRNSLWIICIMITILVTAINLPLSIVLPYLIFMGPISIIALFLSAFVILTSLLFYASYITKIPLIKLLLILAFVFSFFDLNDNHRFDNHFSKETEHSKSLLPLETEFEKWLAVREKDIKNFTSRDKAYPIYLVSAQGGGIYAAYHAASTLARLQDSCPAFAHHIFAISSVSGGSLGATVFSSLVKSEQLPEFQDDCKIVQTDDGNRGPLEQKAHQLLDQDLLSPLLAAGFFPDFIQRFLPVSFEALDRARGLEVAFEQGWKKIDNNGQHPPLLARSYYDHWDSKKSAPALVLNTTVVETGERLLLSPFKFDTPTLSTVRFPNLVDISSVAYTENKDSYIDFPLSTAAVLSARFPFVTPVGWFDRRSNHESGKIKSRLADGGYFENSGFSTAYQIGQGLEEIIKEKNANAKVKFKVIYLAITDKPKKIPEPSDLGELSSPMNALFNARNARGLSIIRQAEYTIDAIDGLLDKKSDICEHRVRQFYLSHFNTDLDDDKDVSDHDADKGRVQPYPPIVCNHDKPDCKSADFNLPLGWYLSKYSQDYIRDRVGNPDACPRDDKSNDHPNVSNNHCIMKSVIDELRLAE